MLRTFAISLALLTAYGASPSSAVETRVPLLDLSPQDVWRAGEGNSVAEYNLWAWGSYGSPVPREFVVPAALSAGEGTLFARTEESFSGPIFPLDT